MACISLKELYESGHANLKFGGHIEKTGDEDGVYYDLYNKKSELVICDGEHVEVADKGSNCVVLKAQGGVCTVYLSPEEYSIAVFQEEVPEKKERELFSRLSSFKQELLSADAEEMHAKNIELYLELRKRRVPRADIEKRLPAEYAGFCEEAEFELESEIYFALYCTFNDDNRHHAENSFHRHLSLSAVQLHAVNQDFYNEARGMGVTYKDVIKYMPAEYAMFYEKAEQEYTRRQES